MRTLIVTLLLLTSSLSTTGIGASECDAASAWAGGCTANNGTTLNISAERTTPDSQSATPPDASDSEQPEDSGPDSSSARKEHDRCLWATAKGLSCSTPRAPTPDPTDPSPGSPAVTITDLASFAPEPVTAVGEPENVGITGMPTNFVAAASVQTRTGTLFGAAIAVRFTPSHYDFHYGDGATATMTTGGSTWSGLRQAQFTPTPTSHVYRQRGTYLADVDVRYTAEVDLGTGWTQVAGELTSDGPTSEIRIYTARTALVAHTCAERPTAPGC